MVTWTKPTDRSPYYVESIPARFTIAKTGDGFTRRYTLSDDKRKPTMLVGIYSTADEAKSAAEKLT